MAWRKKTILGFCLLISATGVLNQALGQDSFARLAAQVEEQAGYSIAYSPEDVPPESFHIPDIKGLDAREALGKVLDPESYDLLFAGKHIIIRKKPPRPQPVEDASSRVSISPAPDNRMADKIPPPPKSVYSGGNRLVIIRDNSILETEELPKDRRPEDQIVRNTSTRDEAAGGYSEEKNLYIPFRTDLLYGQAYPKQEAGEGKKKKDKRKKRA